MKTSDLIQNLIFIVTLAAVILSLFFYFQGQQAIQSQKKEELKATAIALQLDITELKVGVDSLNEVKFRYNNTDCDNLALNLMWTPPKTVIYPPNGAFYAFQKDIAKFNITVARELYSFYYNLQEAEYFRENWASNPSDVTSQDALNNIRLSNKNRCLAAMQTDVVLHLLNQTIESLS